MRNIFSERRLLGYTNAQSGVGPSVEGSELSSPLTLPENGRIKLSTDVGTLAGEGLIQLKFDDGDANNKAKAIISYVDDNDEEVVWLQTHDYLDESTQHKHFSIETAEASGDKHTRLGIGYGTDVVDAQFNLCNVTVTRNSGETNGNMYVQGQLAVGQGSAFGSLDVNDISGNGTQFRGYGAVHTIDFRRANGTITVPTVVASGNFLSTLSFSGYDGANYRNAAAIRAEVDGTPGTNDMPGRLEFFTTPDGSSTLAERMRIINNGNVGIGVTTTIGARLHLAPTASTVGLMVDGAGSQTANLQQWRDSSGNVLAGVDAAGALSARVPVEANTAGSGSPNILTAAETRLTLTNEGTTAKNYHTLPTAVAGYEFTFICQDGDGIRVVANTGDTIRLAGTVSGSAGYTESTTIGSSVTLVAINATEWIATSIVGTWDTV